FDVDIWADREEKGLYKVYYFTVQNGKLKISPTQTVAYVPKFSSSATPIIYWSSAENIYAHEGEEVFAGLMVSAEGKNYDISAPALGVAAYIVSDPTVARVTEYGNIEALKEGTTKITATAYGTTASVNFIVKQSASESDTTKDISISSSEESKPGSSKGGCNVLPGSLILLSLIAVFAKKH
ncbi:MAG: Ig-like domain-containing protein, partial [Synergistaceae bacterium]|nr:Ig-like domain-containing protein [Synergistaceae bacterium]